MSRKRHSPEQIINKLRQAEVELARRRVAMTPLRLGMDGLACAQARLCLLSPKSSHTCSIRGRIFFANLPISGFVS